MDRQRIIVLCATRRGRLFLERLLRLAPDAVLTVVSFREEPWEPPFLDDIRSVAEAAGATFVEAKHLDRPPAAEVWASAPVDLLFAISWRYMVPPAIFRSVDGGAYVFHDSLLPAYRGFSPTVWAILNGERQTGASLIEMAEGVDEGDIVDQRVVAIGPDETIAEVMEGVTGAYLSLLEGNLPALRAAARGGPAMERRPQNAAAATYGCKRLPEDNRIDWSLPARRVYDLIRAAARPTRARSRPWRAAA